ncbi:MAG: helix-turn-helix domain-containing protein [Oscillospiraceae bacterium]|nr:helix-turn-helix domain-containing protein [Oscillospiraceae bacterium]
MENDKVKADFSVALKEWREKSGLSQRALAARIGVCQSAVYRYEHSCIKPSPETAQALIKLGFPLESLQYGGHYNRTAKTALTDEESAFAEKHHKLVFSYLYSRSLSYENWYDVVIFGYLHAVQIWFLRKELHKYKFSVIAYSAMGDAVKAERKRMRHRPKIACYLYDVVPYTEGMTYEDYLCDPRDCAFAF